MKVVRTIGLLVVIAAAFAGGYVYKAVKGGSPASAEKGGRKILYWVDPMHPAYKSDKPGIAPDCGMDLVPVYAKSGTSQVGPGSSEDVRIDAAQQNMIGMKTEVVGRSSGSETLRVPGKVAVDDSRVYRINSGVE